jgi:predicted nucleic acid-binding protein
VKKLRIYLDTSVINFLFADDAPDFRRATVEFFDRYAKRYELFVSEIVRIEAVNKEQGYLRPLRVVSPLEVEDED